MRRPTVLITGAGNGIGTTLAEEFAAAGWDLVLHCHRVNERSQAVLEAVRRRGASASLLEADFAESDAARKLFDRVRAERDRLDALVNNAALDAGIVRLEDMESGFLDRLLAVNLKAPLLCAREAASMMPEGGSIVQIGSVHSSRTIHGHSAYAASKGGLDAMTKALAVELGPRKIRVNALNPGFIEIPRTVAGRADYDREALGRKVPLQRVGFPADVAKVALFLCGEASSYLTGQLLVLDGGSHAVLSTHPDPMGLAARKTE